MSASAHISPAWVAVDWGTSNVRAYAVAKDGTCLDEVQLGKGMGVLAPQDFEPTLREITAGWDLPAPCTVIACGMVGSRQGWQEAPYRAVPCPAQAPTPVRVTQSSPDFQVYILPGIKQAAPADVMRGEETQIAGYLAQNQGWDGILCLPGTHTKWVHVSAGEIVSFRTFMTGEMFQVLSTQTVLKHSTSGKALDEDAFDQALADTMSRPERLASSLFSLRASDLLHQQSAAVARGILSGSLIGAELAAAKPYWLGQQIAIIGASGVGALYARALGAQGITAARCDAGDVTLAGLQAAYAAL